MNSVKKHWKLLLGIIIPILAAGSTVLILVALTPHKVAVTATATASQTVKATTTTSPSVTTTAQVSVPGLQLDTNKNYGDKYADGILPVGDGKYVTDSPKTGYIYSCTANMGGGGASSRGPWFVNNNTEYDINKKIAVPGAVTWQGTYNMVINGSQRVITSNDLPINHTTGIFPIGSSTEAYLYDRNPNSIKAQSYTYDLTLDPTQLATPHCLDGGAIGVMTTGVALFDGLDAGGRDAGAWEVQDNCNGHPQQDGEYHYHTLSSCIKNVSVQTVIGYALDGYPITGPDISATNILTTDDLDECHGIVSQINLDGKLTTSYHYVMTQDFPYSLSCYRGTPITAPGGQSVPPRP